MSIFNAFPRWRRAIWAATALLVLSVSAALTVAAYSAPRFLAEALAQYQSDRQATAWQARTLALIEDAERAFETMHLTPADEQALKTFVASGDTYRIVLFGADGAAFWSTNRSDIGKQIDAVFFTEVLKSGGVHHETATKHPEEIDGFGADGLRVDSAEWRNRLVSKIYVPVFFRGGFSGVVEHRRDNTELIALYEEWLQLVEITAGGATLLLFGGVVIGIVSYTRRKERFLREINDRQKSALERDEKRNREIRLLSELNEWLQSCKSLDELYEMVEAFLSNLFPDGRGSLYIYSNSRDALVGACSWNGGKLHAQIAADDCWGLRRGRAYSYGLNEVDFKCEHAKDHPHDHYLCVPIVAHGETVGLLHLDPGDVDTDTFLDVRRLALMSAEHISLAIANARLRDQLRDQSVTDPLTGLFNRRYFTETVNGLLEGARRHGGAVSLLSIDVDHFKRFNDNHGHDAGDIVLRSVAEILKRHATGRAFASRLGGEEFFIVLPDADAADAAMAAEAVRGEVERSVVRHAGEDLPNVTISVGVASAPEHGHALEVLGKVADAALYAAKASGRNQVQVATGGAPASIDAPETPSDLCGAENASAA